MFSIKIQSLVLVLAGAGVLVPWDATAQPLIRVPQDADLQQAINQVDNGGVVEVSTGTYFSPANGFRIRNLRKSFTLRSAPGAQVILDGQGTNRIVRYEENTGPGRPVTFEGLIFQNGLGDAANEAGAVSVDRGEAVFTGCTFRDNRTTAQGTGGGAVRVADGADASFLNCQWSGNSAFARGGALEIFDSEVDVLRNTFENNRVNLPTHARTSPGGAVYVLDSRVDISESRFEGNEAGFTGGALFIFGRWQDPESTPAAHVTVNNSTFVDNRAIGDPCCGPPISTLGGAVHVEDQATLEVFHSRFMDNRANSGGAMDTYRAIVRIEDSFFQGNEAEATATRLGPGGALFITAADFADPSTENGAINRRPGEVTIERTLFQGSVGQATANQGACILANGDTNRLYGEGGVAQDGNAASNQVELNLIDVVFSDCNVESHTTANASGGALNLRVVDLTMTGSLVIDSHAMDADAVGGGLVAFADSALDIDDTTFANNSAVLRGGGAAVFGSSFQGSNLLFIENEVSPGVNESVQLSEGAGLYTSPHFPPSQPASRHRDVTGLVENSAFINNVGIAVYDVDLDGGPINDVRYDGNRFRSTTFGNTVYINNAVDFFGETVAELNNLVVVRSGAPNTNKSLVNNQSLGSTPREGQVVAAPSAVLGVVPPGDPAPPVGSFLGFAWSGPNANANLAGMNFADASGVTLVTDPGTYNLRVGNTNVDSATVTEITCTTDSLLCLNQERFRLTVDWRDQRGNTGTGQVVPIPAAVPSGDSGLFFFLVEDNWEILVKVLNGCPINNHFWVFTAATTNFEFTLQVTDTVAGMTRSYINPLGNRADAITDTRAFATCDATPPLAPPARVETATAVGLAPRPAAGLTDLAEMKLGGLRSAPAPAGQACDDTATEICLNKGRFRVEVDFEDLQNNPGVGQVVPFRADDSGLFYFFAEDNWEMLIKVLDACATSFNRFWVFFAATTNVGFTLTVTDTDTGQQKQYINPVGQDAETVLDTNAFATCP